MFRRIRAAFSRFRSMNMARSAPPAQGFQTQRTGPGEEVKDQQPFDRFSQDVKHRFADEVAGRPGSTWSRGARRTCALDAGRR